MAVNSGMAIRSIKFFLTSFNRCIRVEAGIIDSKRYFATNSQYRLKILAMPSNTPSLKSVQKGQMRNPVNSGCLKTRKLYHPRHIKSRA